MIKDVRESLEKYKNRYDNLSEVICNELEKTATDIDHAPLALAKDMLQDSSVVISDMIQSMSRKKVKDDVEFRELMQDIQNENDIITKIQNQLDIIHNINMTQVDELILSPFHLKAHLRIHLLSDK